jgi:hypothetical protein
VLCDAGRHERMRELQQDRARLAEDDEALGIDALGDEHGPAT